MIVETNHSFSFSHSLPLPLPLLIAYPLPHTTVRPVLSFPFLPSIQTYLRTVVVAVVVVVIIVMIIVIVAFIVRIVVVLFYITQHLPVSESSASPPLAKRTSPRSAATP
jgi:hypothetical protein